MLPYPNSLHIISQEPPSPNPTFLIPPASLVHDYDFLFPGDRFGSETLEAVVGPLAVAPDGPVVHPLSEPRKGAAMGGRVAARKRPLRTDRHSKIRTALGVRDRRMRLSVDVARDFFALQDLLGFDKASKTVGWLLTQSKPAIDLLSGPLNHGGGADTSTSSSPVVLGSKEAAVDAVSGNKSTDVTESTIEITSDGPKLMEQSCELDWVSSAAFDQPMAWDSGAMDGLSYYY